jgi:putative ATPase
MDCLPDNLRGREYYHPSVEGKEKAFAQRLEEIRSKRKESRKAAENAPEKKPKS